jgi:hypothetical protein
MVKIRKVNIGYPCATSVSTKVASNVMEEINGTASHVLGLNYSMCVRSMQMRKCSADNAMLVFQFGDKKKTVTLQVSRDRKKK